MAAKKGNKREVFLVPNLATKEALAPLAHGPIIWGISIQSFRHLECQSISSDLIDKYLILQICYVVGVVGVVVV